MAEPQEGECARMCAEGGQKGGKRKSQGPEREREVSNALYPALRGLRFPHVLVSEFWPETLQPGVPVVLREQRCLLIPTLSHPRVAAGSPG